jgi:REP element-mobilizing transposase RayT
MARPLRLNCENSFYHVLSRGNERRAIFRTGEDYQKFLDLIAAMSSRFKVEVHAYVLMKNHYHLLIRTTHANLSRAIQWLGVTYAGWFNRTYNRSGHLFQGRFKSFLIEDEHYFTALGYYIHGNPLRAGATQDLWKYEWSSYLGYADKRYQPSWLNTEVMLGVSGGKRKKFIAEQKAYLTQDSAVLDNLRHGLYFGSEEFSDECRQRLQGEPRREKPQIKSLLKSVDIQKCALDIIAQLGVDEPKVIMKARRGIRNRQRDITIYVISQMGAYTNKEIGELFGIGYTTVTEAVKRAERVIKEDKKLKKLVYKAIANN